MKTKEKLWDFADELEADNGVFGVYFEAEKNIIGVNIVDWKDSMDIPKWEGKIKQLCEKHEIKFSEIFNYHNRAEYDYEIKLKQ